jgi:hypothetical protein
MVPPENVSGFFRASKFIILPLDGNLAWFFAVFCAETRPDYDYNQPEWRWYNYFTSALPESCARMRPHDTSKQKSVRARAGFHAIESQFWRGIPGLAVPRAVTIIPL